MADKNRLERLFSAIGVDMERHTTPMPAMPLFQSGIQEPALLQGITIPALYAATFECVVLRSILNHLSVENQYRSMFQILVPAVVGLRLHLQ